MTSLQTSLKQVPINNGYFRVVPSLLPPNAGFTGPLSSVQAYIYNLNNGVLGGLGLVDAATQTQLSTGQALLRDMGVKFLSSSSTGLSTPQVFRRVQIINTAAGQATDGVNGVSAGADSDYLCGYIAMGFGGTTPLGPFIRTG